jgi:hypothetical protein
MKKSKFTESQIVKILGEQEQGKTVSDICLVLVSQLYRYKVKPAFYIFTKDEEGNNQRIGAAFAHKRGKGLNIHINDLRLVAFPPKENTEA